MSNAPLRRKLVVVIIAFGVALTLFVSASLFASKRRAVAPPGVGPAVAHVNGVPIFKGELDAQVASMQRLLEQPATTEDVRAVALQKLVKQEILYQAAPKYGISISDTELTKAIKVIVSNLQAPEMDDGSRQQALQHISSMGLTLEQYPTDSRVLKIYRRGYFVKEMRQWITDRVPLEQRTSAQALESAVDEFIEQQHARVTYP